MSEADVNYDGLVQTDREQEEAQSGHLETEIARLKELVRTARFALYPFTLEDEIEDDIDPHTKVEIRVSDAIAERFGADIINARRAITALTDSPK